MSLILTRVFTDPVRDGWAPVLVLILLYGLGVGLVGQTLGMWVMRIRCVRVSDGRPVGVPRPLRAPRCSSGGLVGPPTPLGGGQRFIAQATSDLDALYVSDDGWTFRRLELP